MESVALVGVQGDSAEQFGELTGRLPPDQVHLEKAVLAVNEPRRVREVVAVRCRDCRDSVRIAFDRHGTRDAVDDNLAVDLRQAAAQRQPRRDDERDREERDDARQFQEELLQDSVTLRIFSALVLPVTPSRSPFVKIARSPTLTCPLASSVSKMSW